MDESEEVLDLVDGNDVLIGTIARGEMAKMKYKHPEGYVRFVNAFLINNKGEIWVPIRGLHKLIAPGGHDFSVAEHVLAGETSEVAVARAFLEEAGLEVDYTTLVHLGTLHPTESKPSFDEVYALYGYNGEDPQYSKDEFIAGSWLDRDDFKKILREKPSKSSLPVALDLLG
jgi:isopentenyldiphosphate isomerase